MKVLDRQRELLNDVNRLGLASFETLAERYEVSEITIRRDLDHLAKAGMLQRVSGGARRRVAGHHEDHIRARLDSNMDLKRRIAVAAVKLVEPRDSLFLDGGTTVVAFARELARADMDLTVVTNSLLVALELGSARRVRLLQVGGTVDHETLTTEPQGADWAEGIHVRKAFFSCTGFVASDGTYENSLTNLTLKRRIASSAERAYLLADHTKWGRRALHPVLRHVDLDAVVTDERPEEGDMRALREALVEIVEAPVDSKVQK